MTNTTNDLSPSWPPFDPPRALTEQEQALLMLILNTDAPGSQALRAQVPTARAESMCPCGCGSITLVVDPALPRADARSPFPEEAFADSVDGLGVSAMLFLNEGRLSLLEFVWFSDGPRDVPPFEAWVRVVWDAGRLVVLPDAKGSS